MSTVINSGYYEKTVEVKSEEMHDLLTIYRDVAKEQKFEPECESVEELAAPNVFDHVVYHVETLGQKHALIHNVRELIDELNGEQETPLNHGDLSDTELERIADLVEEGYQEGELIVEMDPDGEETKRGWFTFVLSLEEGEDEDLAREEAGRLIREGYTSGYTPNWTLPV